MALGDLSADQSSYVDLVTAQTGLARPVVVSWVGTESGWGVNKAGHNYLNIGPGRTYPSVQQAAAAASALVTNSSYYVGIRAAIPAGAGAQIQAIGASPWGTIAANLAAVYRDLTGGPAAAGAAATDVSIHVPIPGTGGINVPTPGDVGKAVTGAAGDVTGAVGSAVADAFSNLIPLALEVGLGLVFTVAAFAFIAMGVNRLTGAPPKGIFQTVSGAVGTVAGAAKLAAV